MGTLGYRALLQYIESNDLAGLKTFLDTRHIPVDDRDEVSKFLFRISKFLEIESSHFSLPFTEWPKCTYGCISKGSVILCP